jgi:hypothetical protein
MTNAYLTEQPPEVFRTPGDTASPVLLNPHKLKFMLLVSPSMDELRQAIEEYALLRLEDRWTELMAPTLRRNVVAGLKVASKKFENLTADVLLRYAGEERVATLSSRAEAMTLDEQRSFLLPLKPKSIAEMLALFKNSATTDVTGYSHLLQRLTTSTSAFEFFGALTRDIYFDIEKSDYTLGSPALGFHQPRIFEFLGLAVTKQWLLFPFLTGESGVNAIRALMHRDNVKRYLNPLFGPPEAHYLAKETRELTDKNSSYRPSVKYIERLVVSSTYRSLAQGSTELFQRCMELVDNEGEDAHRQLGYARRGYNALLKLHNSRQPSAPRQAQVFKEKVEVSLKEFSSFAPVSEAHPRLKNWADRMSAFVRDSGKSPAAGLVRKTTCLEFCDFLAELVEPPERPELAPRALINDFTDNGPCYRNYVQKLASLEVRNQRLNELHQFFAFVQDQLRMEHPEALGTGHWLANPVDVRFDKFAVVYRAGTMRKAIGADIMEVLRDVLVGDDYAWSKQWDSEWAHLVNADTKELVRVWCPSATICLYLMLSVPLRGSQARMLDSGEGDADLFNFDSRKMAANLRQLPSPNRLDPKRKEGFLQVMASGLTSEPDLVGLWICVNKTSDTGYAIPWVSEELLTHLRYQRDWIFRYTHHPNMHAMEDAQGHRNSPTEWVARQQRFYCLFRDPSAERLHDSSLPVSKQKLLKLWGRLCLEAQNRINARAVGEMQRIRLVKPGTENDRYPSAVHDLHTLRVSGITDLLDRGVPLNIVSEYIAGHATYVMTLWYDKPTPGMMRKAMLQASERAGDSRGLLPRFSEDELVEMKPFLLTNVNYDGMYTGFDALEENIGLAQVRHSGICPGTRCEEGGLDDQGRKQPVPVGDRGPSCPQCRFWLTGPAFLLGQAIEGNQLILKIRNKVQSLAKVRETILDAEDSGDSRRADLLRNQADVEERQLNDMLTEWWHRMRFYESSIHKLQDYRDARRSSGPGIGENIVLFRQNVSEDLSFGFGEKSELELKHMLSTCAEVLPELVGESLGAHQDIELAVGKFLAMNDETELSSLYFKMSDDQRLTAANLAVDLLLHTATSPHKATELLEGKASLKSIPQLREGLSSLLYAQNNAGVARERSPLRVRSRK